MFFRLRQVNYILKVFRRYFFLKERNLHKNLRKLISISEAGCVALAILECWQTVSSKKTIFGAMYSEHRSVFC